MATVIGYNNRIDSATLTGWTNNANLTTRYLTQKATASGSLDMDLGSAQSIGLVALVAHSVASGTVTISAGSSAGGSDLYTSGALSLYSGTDFAQTFAAVSARYWRITVSGSGTVGRVFIGPRFAPEWAVDWSPSLQIESRTGISEALSGPEYFDTRPSRRVWRGQYSWLTAAEGYQWLDVQKTMDVSGEVYLIEDDDDTTYRGQRNFMGRLRTLDAVAWPYPQHRSVAVEIGELL